MVLTRTQIFLILAAVLLTVAIVAVATGATADIWHALESGLEPDTLLTCAEQSSGQGGPCPG